MTVSQAIETLKQIEAEHGGDMEIVTIEHHPGSFGIVYGLDFDVIEYPRLEDSEEMTKVCALMELVEPQEVHLKVVK